MFWPSRRRAEPAPNDAAGAVPGGSAGGAGGDPGGEPSRFSAPPSSEPPLASRFSAPPSAEPPTQVKAVSYESMDFSKYGSSIYESEGTEDMRYARQERQYSSYQGQWITNPRARQCINNIQLGAKMGASVGGCFGLLTGAYVAVTQRSFLVLPVSVIGGAVSFGFFLGCGMIVRCEEMSPPVEAICPGASGCALREAGAPRPCRVAMPMAPTLGSRALAARVIAAAQFAQE